MNMEANNTEF